MKKTAILIDIDGTICDSRYPISYLNGERDTNNFTTYYRTLDVVTPITSVIEDIKSLATLEKTPVTLVFLTGRTAESHVMYSTMQFVEKYFGEFLQSWTNITADFYFRPINLHGASLDYKNDKFKMLKTLYNFVHIYEDELSNVQMFLDGIQENCKVHYIRSSYDFALEKQDPEALTTLTHNSCLVIHDIE